MERICRKTYRIHQTALTYIEMKGIVGHIYGVMLALTLSAGSICGQDYMNAPVEISKEKVRIDGKICYSHIVLEKQTLYSISKAYEVSIEDIYRFNPTLKETGLKKNSIIIIPSKDALKNESRSQDVSEVSKVTEIQAEEPIEKTEKKEDKTSSDKKIQGKVTAKEKSQRIHIAKWYEDLDVIAEQYGVSVEAIMAANDLKGRKLSKRQKLLIPYPGEPVLTAESEDSQSISEAVTEIAQNVTLTDSTTVSVQPKTEVNAAILLPLTTADGEPNRNNMDFYCGALLAVYDLANSGIDCRLSVMDIQKGDSQHDNTNLADSDVIIGPVSSADLSRLFSAIGENTLVVSPLDPRAEKLTAAHSSMVQIPTPQSTQYRDLVRWMEEDFKNGDRAVMITEKGARQNAVTTVMKEAMDSSSMICKTFSYSILEGRDVTQPLTDLMTTEGTNRILIASESEAFVNDVIRNLNLLIYNNIDITIYVPSKIRSFETIEVENLHNTSMHVSLAYHIDYNNPDVKNFLLKYRALFNTEPNQFAFQGYDVAKYFIRMCSKYGDNWRENIEDNDSEMLQSSFTLRRQPIGGYVNNGVRRIVYENGYLVRQIK